MKKSLKKKYVFNMTGLQILISLLLSIITWTIVLYICLSNSDINSSIQLIFNNVLTGKISAFKMTMLFFPIIVIIVITIKSAFLISYKNNK